MKGKFGTKQVVPLLLAAFGAVFAVIGLTQLGFWKHPDGPMPGFFPSIMAIVMVASSIASYFMSLKEEEQPVYHRDELMVLAGMAGIIAGSLIIGMIPTLVVFVILWLKLFQKAPWKDTLIVLAVCMAITLGVFWAWLGVQFPWGVFENFM